MFLVPGLTHIFGLVFCSQMRSGNLPNHSYTLVWAGVVAVFTLSTLILELHFGILYPYLNREKAVTIAD